jgi:hypothetical protein
MPRRRNDYEGSKMKYRSPWWLSSILALSLVPLSALADKGPRDDDGVPFQLLQQQIDALRLRVDALEAARTTGQSCPAGQFVAAVSATGVIVCAAPTIPTTAGGGTTPPAPDVFRAALQQAFSGMSGSNVPLPSPVALPFGGVVLTAYDLTVGTAVFAQTSTTTGTITVAIPSFDLRATAPGATFTFSANPGATALIAVLLEATPSGNRRIGAIQTVTVMNTSPISVTGSDPVLVGIIAPEVALFGDTINSEAASVITGLLAPALAGLPEF